LANLRAFNGDVPQILRVGGNTQCVEIRFFCFLLFYFYYYFRGFLVLLLILSSRDHVTYYPNQTTSIINLWDGGDQPSNTSIGPSFWESFTAIEGTKYIVGLNFYKNDSYYIDNLKGEVQQSLKQIPADRLHLFEVGNENDYGALSGFRPLDWTPEDWANEWNNRTESIQTANNSLRFYAPSTCCYNITTPWGLFSPWTIWNSTYNYNRHGWVSEVSQHGLVFIITLEPFMESCL
jgi:hypothetical protein